MALKGNLRDVSLNQLLNLIHLARKTGALTIQKESSPSTVRLFFREGKLIYSALDTQETRLTDALVKVGKITLDQANLIQSRSRVGTDKEQGLLLMQHGILNREEIVQGVKEFILDTVYELITWPGGVFRFDANQLPPEEHVTVPVGLEPVMMEGTRRAQEWEQMCDELPDLNVPLKFSDNPNAQLRYIHLNMHQWKVISFINSRNTIRQIADCLRLDEFQIRRIVTGLQSAGLVDVAQVPCPLPASAPKPFAIANTGFQAEDANASGIRTRGRGEWQNECMKFLPEQSNTLNTEFALWIVPRDYDPYFDAIKSLSRIGKSSNGSSVLRSAQRDTPSSFRLIPNSP